MWPRAGLAGKRGDGLRVGAYRSPTGAAAQRCPQPGSSRHSSLDIYLQLSWGRDPGEQARSQSSAARPGCVSPTTSCPSSLSEHQTPGNAGHWPQRRAPAPQPAQPPQGRGGLPRPNPAPEDGDWQPQSPRLSGGAFTAGTRGPDDQATAATDTHTPPPGSPHGGAGRAARDQAKRARLPPPSPLPRLM